MSIARRVSRRYVLCPAKHQDSLHLGRSFPTGVKSFNFSGRAMTSQPIGLQQSIRFGEDFELDLRPRRLRRGSHVFVVIGIVRGHGIGLRRRVTGSGIGEQGPGLPFSASD